MKYIFIFGVVIVSIFAAGYFIFNASKDNVTSSNSTSIDQSNESSETKKVMEVDHSKLRYHEYSTGILDTFPSKRRVLYFYASWCPTCKIAQQSFRENEGKIPDDVALIRINYNDDDTDEEEKALAKKYGITFQHTFVQIDSKGEKVTIWNGGKIEELLVNIK